MTQSFRKHCCVPFVLALVLQGCASAPQTATGIDAYLAKYPYVYHLVQKDLWAEAMQSQTTYFPPTYNQDGFTHATANPDFLLTIGNHFYPDVPGDWLCLRMSVDSLAATGVPTIFEGTAPVGNKQADFEGTDSELFPHILGGIHPSAVLQAHAVERDSDGRFLNVADVAGDITLYHIVSQKELQTLTTNNVYTPASVALEGYIHFSQLQLILPIANDAYSDREVLYLLQVTFAEDDEDLKWIGDNPDYYRGLDLAKVERRYEFVRGPDGLWQFPEALR